MGGTCLKDESKSAIEQLATHEETWCKKSRALWLKEGGNNTSFFSIGWLIHIEKEIM